MRSRSPSRHSPPTHMIGTALQVRSRWVCWAPPPVGGVQALLACCQALDEHADSNLLLAAPLILSHTHCSCACRLQLIIRPARLCAHERKSSRRCSCAQEQCRASPSGPGTRQRTTRPPQAAAQESASSPAVLHAPYHRAVGCTLWPLNVIHVILAYTSHLPQVILPYIARHSSASICFTL